MCHCVTVRCFSYCSVTPESVTADGGGIMSEPDTKRIVGRPVLPAAAYLCTMQVYGTDGQVFLAADPI